MITENIIKTLSELVSIQSISSDTNHKEDVLKSAEYVNELFSSLGLETKIATSGNSRPADLAQTDIDPTKKTILLNVLIIFSVLMSLFYLSLCLVVNNH